VPPALRVALSVWGAAKLVALVLSCGLWQSGYVQAATQRMGLDPEPLMGPISGWLLGVWRRFDTLHYLEIAAHGYHADTHAELSLMPLLTRAGAVGFGRFTRGRVDRGQRGMRGRAHAVLCRECAALGADTARRSVWLLAFFFTGYRLGGLFGARLALVLGVCVHGRQWCGRRAAGAWRR
jgi:hypothetical protein